MAKYGIAVGLALSVWGVPVEAAPDPVEPKPRAELATFFGPDSYPPLAAAAGEHGMVMAKLAIDPLGTVTACQIISSSNSASLDSATCRIMTEGKTSFFPARDASGNAVAGSYQMGVNWTLPEEPLSPLDSATQRLTLLLTNTGVIKRCELRNMPGGEAVEAMTMCAGFREMSSLFNGDVPETTPRGDAEVVMLIDRTIGPAAPPSSLLPTGMTIVQDVGSEYLVQPDGTRTDCVPVTTLIDESLEVGEIASATCDKVERFAKHQGAPLKVQDRARIAYRLVGK